MTNISTGKEKEQAYKVNYARYNKAIKEEFYLEALVIGYAIIEDRLVSFLHHCGIISRDNEKLSVNRKLRPFILISLDVLSEKPPPLCVA